MNDTIFKDTIYNDSLFIKDSIYTFQHNINLMDNSDNSQLLTNSLTIGLALIAALIALYQIKLNIISNARISWIENLRNAISTYTVEISNCGVILTNLISDCKGKNDDEAEIILNKYYEKYEISSTKSGVLGNKILLYLNSQEPNHNKIEELIKKLDNHLHETELSNINRDEIETDIDEIIKISKVIFKTEWEKSKKIFKI